MQKSVFLQLLAVLAVLSWNLADAKAFEADNEVLTIEKRDEAVNVAQEANDEEEEVVTKREPENQEEEEEEMEKRDPENQEEEEEEEEEMEKRDPDNQDEEEEEMEKREPENQEEMEERDPENQEEEEEMEKRDPENQEEEEEMEKRDPENQEEEEEEMEKRDPEYQEEEEKEEKRETEDVQTEKTVEEKREDTPASDSEVSDVEDLEARTVQARFTLVDRRGRRINGEREGLLLFNGGTVCDDGFSTNSANAVCRTMGYRSATRFRHGLVYGTFQSRKRIGLDDVICSSHHWASCRSTTRHNCVHSEDILLTCHGTGFKLLNRAGHVVTGQREGLLTYQHGTVCDDYFNWNSAHAICRVMGYSSAARYRHGLRYGTQQSHRAITMDDVRCRSSYWNYCSYRSAHNCVHSEDIFLTCRPGTSHAHGFRLVDWRGATAARGCEGLLLWNGGTVCDDYFNMNAAHAICRTLGFRSATRYRNGLAYGAMQTRKTIRMDNVRCTSRTWSRCHYSTTHNCNHGEDILLTCHA
ncbi:deleted in malignant brain tumors 1 protein-like [Bolinopsis microptera]|uniref:deleted in malignant brain tumors 1 protein-like n=1 Tax=Bolinopsis microptera TaxID=2820187 RepID=UPI003079F7E0